MSRRYFGCLSSLARYPRWRRPSDSGPKLLSLDSTYSWEMMKARKLEHEILCRDLDGFFEHVWSVHPLVGASPEHARASAVGSPSTIRVADRHTMIEGRVGQFTWLTFAPVLNFTAAQAVLLVRLLRIIRAEHISIIRAGDPFYHSLLGLLLARWNGLPLVVRINANQDSMYAATGELAYPRLLPSRAVEQRVARFVLQRADLVAPGSQDNLQFALNNGARLERSTLFRYGSWVDPVHFTVEPRDRLSVRKELDFDERPFVILVSRLEPVKHPDDVLRALAHARSRLPELGAVLVGDGTMRSSMEAMAVDLGVADDVRFVGNQDQIWIAAALASASVVLSPLTGRALVEACLSGTPVVAYDVEWHSELIATDATGILVPYRDVRAMGDAVCALVSNPSLAASIGERARAATLRMMDPVRLMDHERKEYSRLLRGDPDGASSRTPTRWHRRRGPSI